jgi:hypothetical protein
LSEIILVMRLSTDAKIGLAFSLVLVVGGASSAPWWWHELPWAHGDRLPPGVVGFSGGCDAFQVYAQNRWVPYGASVRAAPNIDSTFERGLPGQFAFDVNGWVHSRPAFPTNTAPWNSDVWFHMADNSGWVDFAAVRAEPVAQDPTGLSTDGGVPVPTTNNCEGSLQ